MHSPIIEQMGKALDYIEREKRTLTAETRTIDRPGVGLEALVTRLAEVRALHARLKAITTGINQLAEHLAYETLPSAMDRRNTLMLDHEAGKVSLAMRTSASIMPEMKQRAFDWLRKNGHSDLIIETVNAQTLGATARELIEAGGELPDDLFKTTVKRYAKLTLKGDKDGSEND